TPHSALRSCWGRIPPSSARPFSRHDRRWSSPRGGFMLFMVIERFRPGRAPDIYRRFRDKGRLAPEGLRYVSSWVALGFTRCFQVMEADSEAILAEWTANWEDLVDFEIVPVRTSAEAAAAIAPELE